MKPIQRILTVFMLIALFAMTFTTPARAFDGRSGDVIVIESGEVVNEDLYVTANEFTLDGTVEGDLIVFGNFITINGTVEGDLFAGGDTIVIEGTVTDDARIAGAALQLGSEAVIGGDLISAGASLETRDGSLVENDAVFAGAQALLSGGIGRNLLAAGGGLEIRGEIGGDVTAEIGDPAQQGPSPATYITDTKVAIPSVSPGIKIDDDAKIGGNFTYTQSKEIEIPSGAVGGEVTRKEPVVDERNIPTPPTAAEVASNWTLDLIRHIVTLAIFGLLLAWLAPLFMKALMEKMQTQPAPAFGWGIVAYAAFFFGLFLLVVVTIIAGVIFGALTLGGVSGTIIWLSLVLLFALIVGFVLFTGFGSQILVAWLGGRWILGRFNPALAENKVWPLLLGVVIVGLLVKLPVVGWLAGFIVMFFGLGALWLWLRERMQKPAVVAVQP